jgi:hypothetical protein
LGTTILRTLLDSVRLRSGASLETLEETIMTNPSNPNQNPGQQSNNPRPGQQQGGGGQKPDQQNQGGGQQKSDQQHQGGGQQKPGQSDQKR